MSADNITACPQCSCLTLAEYWELGIDGGEFYVDYSAECRGCTYKFTYKHEQPALILAAGGDTYIRTDTK